MPQPVFRPAPCAPIARAAFVIAALAATVPPAQAAWPTTPYSLGTPVRVLSGSSAASPVQVADGAGGIFVVWQDGRGGTNDLYAQHLTSAGVARWTANGTVVSNAAGTQGIGGADVTAVADGNGGLLVAWTDSRNSGSTGNDIYAQRLDSTGTRQWGASDLLVCNAAGAQSAPVMVGDGAGGAIVAWIDARSGNTDVYARRLLANGTASWTANGNVVCSQASAQTNAVIADNGAGGAIVAWIDARNSATTGNDLYAQALSNGGSVAWTANGVGFCTNSGIPSQLVLARDGSNGAVAVWTDGRTSPAGVYAQRLAPTGASLWVPQGQRLSPDVTGASDANVCPLSDGTFGFVWTDGRAGGLDLYAQKVAAGGFMMWTPGGAPVAATSSEEDYGVMMADGAGGFFVGIFLYQFSLSEVQVQHMTAGGLRDWGTAGAPLCLYDNSQSRIGVSPDGSGGVLVSYIDLGWSGGASQNLFAAHADAYGQMGDARPAITSIRDVAGDQGGEVALQWTASPLEGDANQPISQYTLWRKVPIAQAAGAAARLARQSEGAGAAPRAGTLRAAGTSLQPVYWEYLGLSPARGRPGYTYVAPTTADSGAAGILRTSFMVSAECANGHYWDSTPDSGYSVDNLAPAAPAPFTGSYASGTADLAWGASGEPDLASYRLYRGGDPGFVPDAGHFVTSIGSLHYADVAGAPYWYKLTAVDVHGNESAAASLLPSGTLGVEPGGAPRVLALESVSPHPLRGGASARVRFAVPRAGHTSLALFDSQGRRVRRLLERPVEAGAHELALEAVDAAGHPLRAGLYFLRLAAGDETRMRRVVLLE